LEIPYGFYSATLLSASRNKSSESGVFAVDRHKHADSSGESANLAEERAIPEQGGVSAFRVRPATGALTFLNRVSAEGSKPNQVTIHPSGRIAVVVNYTTGNVVAYKVRPDGSLTEGFWIDQHVGEPISAYQRGPKAHGIAFSRDGRFLYVADLGLDLVYGYRVDVRQGTITAGHPAFATTHAGAGPRRIQIGPSGKFLYVNHETDSEVSVFAVDGTNLKELQTISTLPAGYAAPNTTAEILISSNGRFLYVSNRGHDSIAVFRVNEATGRLVLEEDVPVGGHTPRNIRLDPTGNYLLSSNEDSGTITVFKINKATGQLSSVASTAEIDTPASLCFVRVRSKP
jgi:6-phosphogluconolactonase